MQALADEILVNIKNVDLVFWKAKKNELKNIKLLNTAIANEKCLNECWFLEEFCNANIYYLNFFKKCQNGKFYEGWCDLEQAEIAISNLIANEFFEFSMFNIKKIANQIQSWQKLFPYKLFFSPEFLERKKECSICKTLITPWSKCLHKIKKVYHGEQCVHVVTDMEILGISIVREPVQKYSVLMLSGESDALEDKHNYSAIIKMVGILDSPYEWWEANLTKKLISHNHFENISPLDECPCGSELKYRNCCLIKPGVLYPHIDITFEDAELESKIGFEVILPD